jgi:hypothetical protein
MTKKIIPLILMLTALTFANDGFYAKRVCKSYIGYYGGALTFGLAGAGISYSAMGGASGWDLLIPIGIGVLSAEVGSCVGSIRAVHQYSKENNMRGSAAMGFVGHLLGTTTSLLLLNYNPKMSLYAILTLPPLTTVLFYDLWTPSVQEKNRPRYGKRMYLSGPSVGNKAGALYCDLGRLSVRF